MDAYAKAHGAPQWSFDPQLPDTAWSGLDALTSPTGGRHPRRSSRHDARYASHLSDEEVAQVVTALAGWRLDAGRLRLLEAIRCVWERG